MSSAAVVIGALSVKHLSKLQILGDGRYGYEVLRGFQYSKCWTLKLAPNFVQTIPHLPLDGCSEMF